MNKSIDNKKLSHNYKHTCKQTDGLVKLLF